MKSLLLDLNVQDMRAEGGVIAIIAQFEGGLLFSRHVAQPYAMDEVAKALYLLATDIMRAALPGAPGILNIT